MDTQRPAEAGGPRRYQEAAGAPPPPPPPSSYKGVPARSCTPARLRERLEAASFSLGCKLQRNCGKALFVGVLAFCAFTVGLRAARLETDVEALWVEVGGRLSREVSYTHEHLGPDSALGLQLLIQTPRGANNEAGKDGGNAAGNAGVLTPDGLAQHLRSAHAASRVSVNLYGRNWDLNKICYKPGIPLTENRVLDQAMEKLIPCVIVTPLDCFWDGAKLQGGKFYLSSTLEYRWTNLDPQAFLQGFQALRDLDLGDLEELLSRAEVGRGYVDRPCLDPTEPDCPASAPNKQRHEPLDIGRELSKGCHGFSRKFMSWQDELIIGGARHNSSGSLASAEALQTMFVLMNAQQLYETYKDNYEVYDLRWTLDKAAAILDSWQRKFVEVVHASVPADSAHDVLPFSTATIEGIMKSFSEMSVMRVAGGYVLMLVYACVVMMRWECGRSHGAVGLAGVLLVALSVASGLGFCSIVGLTFNAATTQVLPFLALGVGVDDMFLLAHAFVGQSDNIPFKYRLGECLRETGTSVVLTSVNNLVAFLMAALIPIPALRNFSLQAAVVIVFNLAMMLLVFPAVLALDLRRRRQNRMDFLCCLPSPCADRVVTVQPGEYREEHGSLGSHSSSSTTTTGSSISTDAASIAAPHAVATTASFPVHGHATAFTMRATVTAVARCDPSGQHVITVLPAAAPRVTAYAVPVEVAPAPSPCSRHSSCSSSAPGPDACTSTRDLIAQVEEAAGGAGAGAPAPGGECGNCSPRATGCLGKWTASEFARDRYAPLLLRTPVKVVAVVSSLALLATCLYGTTLVRDGLDLMDVVPRGTRERAFLEAQARHFSLYAVHVVTTAGVDYPRAQAQLYALHERVGRVRHAVRHRDGAIPKMWLHYFRDWLLDLQKAFDAEWASGRISRESWRNGSEAAVLAMHLMVQTGDHEQPINYGQLPAKRLVGSDGMIDPDTFYECLTAWASSDPLGYAASQAAIHPQLPEWIHDKYDSDPEGMHIQAAAPIEYTHFSFFLGGLRETSDFLSIIETVRAITEEFSERGVPCYPSGLPFLFWEQYVGLRQWLLLSVVLALAAAFLVTAACLLSPWTAAIVVLVLAAMTVELFGVMGFLGVRLSASPVVTLVLSVGIGVEFTVHTALAFTNATGGRDRRVAAALEKTLVPVLHGAASTFLGVVMLAASEFDFIVRYFFGVLTIMTLLGVLNGLVLLPVLLSVLGPPSQAARKQAGGVRVNAPPPPARPACHCAAYAASLRYLDGPEAPRAGTEETGEELRPYCERAGHAGAPPAALPLPHVMVEASDSGFAPRVSLMQVKLPDADGAQDILQEPHRHNGGPSTHQLHSVRNREAQENLRNQSHQQQQWQQQQQQWQQHIHPHQHHYRRQCRPRSGDPAAREPRRTQALAPPGCCGVIPTVTATTSVTVAITGGAPGAPLGSAVAAAAAAAAAGEGRRAPGCKVRTNPFEGYAHAAYDDSDEGCFPDSPEAARPGSPGSPGLPGTPDGHEDRDSLRVEDLECIAPRVHSPAGAF